MNIIHDVKTLPRLVDDALVARLRVMPAVVLTGARQTGKSTLVEQLVPGKRRYRSLDDFDVRDAARRAAEAPLRGAPRVRGSSARIQIDGCQERYKLGADFYAVEGTHAMKRDVTRM